MYLYFCSVPKSSITYAHFICEITDQNAVCPVVVDPVQDALFVLSKTTESICFVFKIALANSISHKSLCVHKTKIVCLLLQTFAYSCYLCTLL